MEKPYYLFKAYLPNGQLIKTKKVLKDDFGAIVTVYQDMHALGVQTYYVTDGKNGNRKFTLTVPKSSSI